MGRQVSDCIIVLHPIRGKPANRFSNALVDWLAIQAGLLPSQPYDQSLETSKIVRSLLKFHT
jgi:hypothetical protein